MITVYPYTDGTNGTDGTVASSVTSIKFVPSISDSSVSSVPAVSPVVPGEPAKFEFATELDHDSGNSVSKHFYDHCNVIVKLWECTWGVKNVQTLHMFHYVSNRIFL